MAKAIVTTHPSNLYVLPEADRQAILTGEYNPGGKISGAWRELIEQQREQFISLNGDEFGQTGA